MNSKSSLVSHIKPNTYSKVLSHRSLLGGKPRHLLQAGEPVQRSGSSLQLLALVLSKNPVTLRLLAINTVLKGVAKAIAIFTYQA